MGETTENASCESYTTKQVLQDLCPRQRMLRLCFPSEGDYSLLLFLFVPAVLRHDSNLTHTPGNTRE